MNPITKILDLAKRFSSLMHDQNQHEVVCFTPHALELFAEALIAQRAAGHTEAITTTVDVLPPRAVAAATGLLHDLDICDNKVEVAARSLVAYARSVSPLTFADLGALKPSCWRVSTGGNWEYRSTYAAAAQERSEY